MISYLNIIYDNENKKYIKGRVIEDGIPRDCRDEEEIKYVLTELKRQRGVSKASELDASILTIAYNQPGKIAAADAAWDKAVKNNKKELIKKAKLNKKADEKRAENLIIDEEEEKNSERCLDFVKKALAVATVGLGVVVAVTAIKSCSSKKKDKTNVINDINTEIDGEIVSQNFVKLNPNSYEDFKSTELSNPSQQKFFVDQMNWMNSNIITIYNEEENMTKYAISQDLVTSFNIYYNLLGNSNISNDEIVSIIGDYDITNVGIKTQEFLDYARYTALFANPEDMIDLGSLIVNEDARNMYQEYYHNWIDYRTASTDKEKKAAITAFENMLANDYLSENKVDELANPATTLPLQVFLNAYKADGVKFNNKNVINLVGGVETNYDERGKLISTAANGVVDSACAPIIERADSYAEYVNNIMRSDEVIDAANNVLIMTSDSQEEYNSRYQVSKYDELTESTFSVDNVIIPMLNDELVNNGYVIDDGQVMTKAIVDTQSRMESSVKTNIGTNVKNDKPATNTKVEVDEKDIPEDVKEEAKEDMKEKEDIDVVFENPTEEDLNNLDKQQSVNLQEVYNNTYNIVINGGEVTFTGDPLVDDIMRDAMNDARNYLIQISNNGGKEQSSSSSSTTTSEDATPIIGSDIDVDGDGKTDGVYSGDTNQNPNQKGQIKENENTTTTTSTTTVTSTSTTESVYVVNPEHVITEDTSYSDALTEEEIQQIFGQFADFMISGEISDVEYTKVR